MTSSAHLAQLVEILARLSPAVHDHGIRVLELARHLIAQLEVTEESRSELLAGSCFLHDIGKLAVREDLLTRNGPLSTTEMQQVRQHADIGANVLAASGIDAAIVLVVRHHHEWWNGGGYPRGLSGNQIPALARLISVVDAYDAMTSARPYRRSLSSGAAIAELQRCSGTQFDPAIVDKFSSLQISWL
ncbi:hypothetical protein BH23CHL5_BH23CHL5_11420 [soil metagenome]